MGGKAHRTWASASEGSLRSERSERSRRVLCGVLLVLIWFLSKKVRNMLFLTKPSAKGGRLSPNHFKGKPQVSLMTP
ncbi:MAG: hypothetical protein A2Z72_04980 [Omnitrophica bacterium RBG_13_46_9]|nr:MAG: hypothetical protein A2Z72_04980 [Omnitrophica bacterium RBG_13_46_9]